MAFTDQCQYFCFSDAIIAETTCTTHFGITEKAAVGTVSNMFEIMEILTGANSTLIF